MKKNLISYFLVLISYLLFLTPAHAAVIINEFSPASATEWVELLNTDSGASVSLANYKISNGSTVLATLSGTLPKSGLLTFELPAASLIDAGDCLVVLNAANTGVYSISFGSGSCGSGTNFASTASSSQSIGLTNGSTWALLTTPSRGWCNDSYGGCPTISTIVSTMTSSGVATNLGTQSDYSRITGLYFEKTGYGKITFQDEMNFTDTDTMSWMQSLNTKLDLSTLGKIALDADLIKNLMSTQATLTMYNLTLSDPEILVDGAADSGSVVSGISYSGGTLVFTAAHFTTFTTRERASSSSSSSSPGPAGAPGCGTPSPLGTPDLFQINRKGSSAILFFTPVNHNSNYYYIAYGTDKNAQTHGVQFDQGYYPGVLSYTINHLKPGQKYYFKVRAGNGCAPGQWGNILSSKSSRSYRY